MLPDYRANVETFHQLVELAGIKASGETGFMADIELPQIQFRMRRFHTCCICRSCCELISFLTDYFKPVIVSLFANDDFIKPLLGGHTFRLLLALIDFFPNTVCELRVYTCLSDLTVYKNPKEFFIVWHKVRL